LPGHLGSVNFFIVLVTNVTGTITQKGGETGHQNESKKQAFPVPDQRKGRLAQTGVDRGFTPRII